MDRSTVDEANQVAEQMAETIRESYQAIADRAVEIQERNVLFFESLFEAWNETLKGQAETNRAMVQSLAEQTDRQWEAFRKMVPESVEAYTEFLYSLFPYPNRVVRRRVEAGEAKNPQEFHSLRSIYRAGVLDLGPFFCT